MSEPPPVYLIFGDDDFSVNAKGKAVIKQLVPEGQEALGLEMIEGNAGSADDATQVIRRCIEAVRTVGFLGGSKVVWLRDAGFFTGTAVGRTAAAKESVRDLTAVIDEGLPPGQILVITTPGVDRKTVFYKTCKKHGEIHEYSTPDKAYKAANQALDRVAEEARRLGLKMSSDVRDAFLDRAGTDTRQIVNELEKLSVYMGERKDVGISDVRAVVSTSSSVAAWDFADAVAGKDLPRALKVARRLLFQKEEPIGLIIGLERRIEELLIIREAYDRGWVRQESRGTAVWNVPGEAQSAFDGLKRRDPRSHHPYRAGKLVTQAKTFRAGELGRWQALTVNAHEQLVSSGVPKSLILEMLILKLLGARKVS